MSVMIGSLVTRWTVLLLLLAGCGGGVYVSYSCCESDPPRVDLVASDDEVSPGQAVQLAASAVDDSGLVDRVSFFRYDGNSLVLLATDLSPPFEAVFVVPSDGRLSVNLQAQAVNGEGDVGSSAVVTLTVR